MAKKNIQKNTPSGATTIAQVMGGDTGILEDGRRAQVCWQSGETTFVRWGNEKPREGPFGIPSETPIVGFEELRRQAPSTLDDGDIDPLTKGGGT